MISVTRRRNPVLIGLAVLATCLAAVAVAPTHSGAAGSRVVPRAVIDPHYVRAERSADAMFSCQNPGASINCYVPSEIRTAYNVQSVLNSGITGAGRTIVIVDAYGDPDVAADLNVFDTTFGLPAPTLNILYPNGQPTFDPTNADEVNWSGEIALDTQWAHVIAPGATLDLVIAKSDADADILAATTYAVNHNLGDVISQSFGEAETCLLPSLGRQEHALFERATLDGMTLIASSGDNGAAQPTCDGTSFLKSASTPASDPLVLAVGGTSLTATQTSGAYQSETTWNDVYGASGGGFSTSFAKPLYQYGISSIGRYRGTPDVAYSGDVNNGVLTAWSQGDPTQVGSIYVFGGTSAGSPQWAGITALADQKARTRLGWLNPAIYLLGHSPLYSYVFHDVTTGNNSVTEADSAGNPVSITGYQAGRGWDATTGWGSPNVGALLSLLPSASRTAAAQS